MSRRPLPLALSIRSAQETSRARGTHLGRALLLAALGVAVLFAHSSASFGQGAGTTLLSFTAWIDFCLLSLVGIGAFAVLIAEERETRTLDLLRLAGFSPWAILFGKTAGIGLQFLALLLLQIPFCLLAITLGGVTIVQIAHVFAILLTHTAIVFGIGLLASVIASTNRRATSLALVLLFAYYLLPLGILSALADSRTTTTDPVSRAMLEWLENSPLYSLITATSWQASFTSRSFLTPVLTGLAIGAGLVLAAGLLFDRFHSGGGSGEALRPASPAGRRPEQRWTDASRVKGDPLRWKDFHFVSGGNFGLVWRSLVLVAVAFGVGGWVFDERMLSEAIGMALFWVGAVSGTLIAASLAGAFLRQEVRARTWPLLYALPRSMRSVLLAKLVGTGCAVLPSLAFMLLGLMISPVGAAEVLDGLFSANGFYFVCLIVLLCYLTTYLSLRVRWGAMPIAVAILFLGNVFIAFVIQMVIRHRSIDAIDAILGALACGALILCAVLHREILALLRRAAADG